MDSINEHHTPTRRIPFIPPELLLTIVCQFSRHGGAQASILSACRLVSRSWAELLRPPLFTDITVTLDRDHSLGSLITFLSSNATISETICKLTIKDSTSRKSALKRFYGIRLRYRCESDANLLMVALLYLHNLQDLVLYNFIPGLGVTRCDADRVHIRTLTVNLPGNIWDDSATGGLLDVIQNVLSVFQTIDSLIIPADRVDSQYYTFLSYDYPSPQPELPLPPSLVRSIQMQYTPPGFVQISCFNASSRV